MGHRVTNFAEWIVGDHNELLGYRARPGDMTPILTVDNGNLVGGEWKNVPSMFRLQMTGTGTVTLDSKDALGNITLGVYTATLSGATNEIGFPYAGDAAIYVRATLTGTATAKVI